MEKKVEEEWRIQAKKADFEGIAKKFAISACLARLIRNRDVTREEDIYKYLFGGLQDLYSPGRMKDMTAAAELLLDAVRNGLPIRIIGDYDADGVCSIAILYRGLSRLSSQVDWTMPDRIRDGYGLNVSLVEQAHADGIQVILTCDNGIAAGEAIRRAKEYGMKVIVTDHHELPKTMSDGIETAVMPEADAVVDPKRPDCEYPFPGLCGAAIAWKLTGLLLIRADIADREALMEELLEYAGIATVTDVCDLVDENRILVKEALSRLRKTKIPGLQALMEVQQVNPETLSAYHIGFILGPALNASGRLDTAKTAVDLLLCRDETRAKELALRLKELNDERKNMTLQGVEEAEQIIEKQKLWRDRILVVYLPDCHESLAGIIAGRIRERYARPAIVLTKGQEMLKGSGRSTEAYHMFEGLTGVKEYLERFGGHPMAAGLSLKEENLEEFRRALNDACSLTEKDLVQKVWIDLILPFGYITPSFVEELEKLEPFGKGNTKPVFAERNLRILSMRLIGKNRNVLRLILCNEADDQMEAILFQETENFLGDLTNAFSAEEVEKAMGGKSNALRIHITYYPEIDHFGGKERLQVVVSRWKMAGNRTEQ